MILLADKPVESVGDLLIRRLTWQSVMIDLQPARIHSPEFMRPGLSTSIALSAAFSAIFWNLSVVADTYAPFAGEKTTWHDGFARFDYLMDEESFAVTPFKRPESEKFAVGNPPKGQRRCIVVVPKQAAPGHPWSWQACYWDHEPQAEVELLRRGFHIAFITPDPGKQWDAWYAWLTEKHGLSKKPAFVGMSRGGLNEYD